MGANSKIEWTDHTFNPWIGCQHVSPACDHCYAEVSSATRATAARIQAPLWGPGSSRYRTSPGNWREPLKWNREAAADGQRRRVFCASLADVFDNHPAVAPWRADLFRLIRETPNLDWLLLTKRVGNASVMIADAMHHAGMPMEDRRAWPWPNVWLGATVVNQEEADRDIPKLLRLHTARRFLSVEPMLSAIDLRRYLIGHEDAGTPLDGARTVGGCRAYTPPLDWVIVGGESGHHARPMHPQWVRDIRDQCAAAGVPFLFKQWGEFLPAGANEVDPSLPDVPATRLFWSDGSAYAPEDGQRGGVDLCARLGKAKAGRELDGRTHDGFPA